jgi:hypothetical protein
MILDDWISGPLLAPSTVERLTTSLRSDAMATILLDDFLKPNRLGALRSVFENDAPFAEKFQIRLPDGRFEEVAEEAFLSVDETARVERQLLLDGTPSLKYLSPGIAQHINFMAFARHPAFADFLGRIGGIEGLRYESGEARIMRAPHMVKPHSDGRRGLCAVLYVHASWDPRCGGRLVQYARDATLRHVDPMPNRLVIFLPGSGRRHAVEPIVQVDGWQRCSYSLWFERSSAG